MMLGEVAAYQKLASRDYYRRNREKRMAYTRQWRTANPDYWKTRQAYRQKWREANRDKERAYGAKWRANHPLTDDQRQIRNEYTRRWRMRKIGLEEITAGPYLCPICKKREGTVMDHDHETGLFRGMLCQQCNVGIGIVGESNLRNALNYLER